MLDARPQRPRQEGVAGVSVLTTEFEQAFNSQKSAIGLDAAAVCVPHPLQNKVTKELHALADKAVEDYCRLFAWAAKI
jgi:hypothetical protein